MKTPHLGRTSHAKHLGLAKRRKSVVSLPYPMDTIKPFVRVPLDVAFSDDLKGSELGFAVQFLALWWKRGEPVGLDYSVRDLAKEFCMDHHTVIRLVNSLIEKRMVKRLKGKGNSYLYCPTEKLTGKSDSICVMSSGNSGPDWDAVLAHCKLKKLLYPDETLQAFQKASKAKNVSTAEILSFVESIAKARPPVTLERLQRYVHGQFKNLLSQRRGSAPLTETPKRHDTEQVSATESATLIVRHIASYGYLMPDMLPKPIFQRWEESSLVSYNAERDVYVAAPETFFYVRSDTGTIHGSKISDFETISRDPAVIVPVKPEYASPQA